MLIQLVVAALAALPTPLPDKRVHDFAEVVPPEVESQIERMCLDAEAKTTAQIAVVTVASLDGKTVDEYAHELFNAWGVGQRETNNGVLLLVAPSERRVRIEVGTGLEGVLTDSRSGRIIDAAMLPRFKTGDYPGGILAAAREIADTLGPMPSGAPAPGSPTKVVSPPGSTPRPSSFQPSRHAARSRSTGALLALILAGVTVIAALVVAIQPRAGGAREYGKLTFVYGSGLLAVLVIVTFVAGASGSSVLAFPPALAAGAVSLVVVLCNLGRYNRYGPRYCTRCSTTLTLLDELADDQKLTVAQQLEERIGSINYDVWVCPACLAADVVGYINWFSGFGPCPGCNHRTFDEKVTIERHATEYSTGTRRIDGQCLSCKHTSIRREVIPRVEPTQTRTSALGSSSLIGGGIAGHGHSSGHSSALGGGGSSHHGGISHGGGSSHGGFGGGSSRGGGASRGW